MIKTSMISGESPEDKYERRSRRLTQEAIAKMGEVAIESALQEEKVDNFDSAQTQP